MLTVVLVLFVVVGLVVALGVALFVLVLGINLTIDALSGGSGKVTSSGPTDTDDSMTTFDSAVLTAPCTAGPPASRLMATRPSFPKRAKSSCRW